MLPRFHRGVGLPRCAIGDEIEREGTEAPDIQPDEDSAIGEVVRVEGGWESSGLLGRDVARRAGDLEGAITLVIFTDREPEVRDPRAARERRDEYVVRLEVAMKDVAEMSVVNPACDVAHPAHGFGEAVRADGRCGAARREHASARFPFADQLHDDVRRPGVIGIVNVEHADDVIARDLRGGAGLGENLVEYGRALPAEHLDRDVAVELCIVRLPHRGGGADVEQHAETIALARDLGCDLVVVDPLAIRAQPDHGLRGERRIGEALRDELGPMCVGPCGDLRERFDQILHVVRPASILWISTR